ADRRCGRAIPIRGARSYPHPHRRRQEPRQGSWEAYGPTAEADTAATERGSPAARGRGHAQGIGRHLQCRAGDDFTADGMRSTETNRVASFPEDVGGTVFI